jgi:hypothetical protein
VPWDTLFWIALATVVVVVAAYFALRWLAFRVATRAAALAEDHLADTVAAGLARTRASRPVPAIDSEARRRLLADMDRLAWLMDRVIPLPIVGGIGLDALVGLAPVVGDAISLAISSVLIVRAAQLGAPPTILSRLIAMQCIDLALGAVPIVGDMVDVGYKANQRSVDLIRKWLKSIDQ